MSSQYRFFRWIFFSWAISKSLLTFFCYSLAYSGSRVWNLVSVTRKVFILWKQSLTTYNVHHSIFWVPHKIDATMRIRTRVNRPKIHARSHTMDFGCLSDYERPFNSLAEKNRCVDARIWFVFFSMMRLLLGQISRQLNRLEMNGGWKMSFDLKSEYLNFCNNKINAFHLLNAKRVDFAIFFVALSAVCIHRYIINNNPSEYFPHHAIWRNAWNFSSFGYYRESRRTKISKNWTMNTCQYKNERSNNGYLGGPTWPRITDKKRNLPFPIKTPRVTTSYRRWKIRSEILEHYFGISFTVRTRFLYFALLFSLWKLFFMGFRTSPRVHIKTADWLRRLTYFVSLSM